jgi:phage terminase large subunit-like protein
VGKRGPKPKSAQEHLRAGTYRADRHGPLVQPSEIASRPEPRPKAQCGPPSKWSRSAADEYAIRNGCWFDERRAQYVVDWFRNNLQLSDSIWTGQPFELQPWQRDEIIFPLFGWMRTDERGQVVRRFNQTYIEIPKKNGKSTLAAGIGLYMLVGEGNRGNEVYSAATDKDQAGIVHNEAIRMVESSPKLSALLFINHTTKAIYSNDLQVNYKAIASRPAGSEGLKGNCVIIDELHAWHGDLLWNSLKYMGVNWPERLRFVITTAGDDPESICRQQYDLGKSIENGTILNDRMLVCIHEAQPTDDLRDEAVQRKANPSLGVTILKSDLDDDITEAEKSPRTLAVLKRYRFNVWQQSTNPWLDAHVWASAADEDGELVGLPCWGALDLARKGDMTAFSLLFQRESDLLLKSWFWLPRGTVQKWEHLTSYAAWAADGHLTITDGDAADYARIESEIVDLCRLYSPREITFDDLYAEEITQRISDVTGIERIDFPQTVVAFAGPTAAFERMLTTGELRHDGNAVLTWQAGHVQVKCDVNQNIRPVKPGRDTNKSIDGIVSGVMALARLLQQRAEPDVSNEPVVTVLAPQPKAEPDDDQTWIPPPWNDDDD